MAELEKLIRSENKNKNQENRNPERATHEALKCIGIQVGKFAKAEYVSDLFRDLRKKNTPLRSVIDLVCNKMCPDIKQQQMK